MFPQTVGQRDYVFHCLGACGNEAVDKKQIYLLNKLSARVDLQKKSEFGELI